MTSSSPSQQRVYAAGLLAYALGSAALALFYWGAYLYIDSLPCREILCNLDWILLFFGPILLIFVAAPLVNGGLLAWERRRPAPLWPLLRLAFSAVGAGFSALIAATFVLQLARRGIAMIDLSPQSLIFAVVFVAATWLNLRGADTLLRKAGLCLGRCRPAAAGHWNDAIG